MNPKRLLLLSKLKARRNVSTLFGVGVGGAVAATADPNRKRFNPITREWQPLGLTGRVGRGAVAGIYAGLAHGGLSRLAVQPRKMVRALNRDIAKSNRDMTSLTESMGLVSFRPHNMKLVDVPNRAKFYGVMHPLQMRRAKRIIGLRDARYAKDMGIRLD